jgi:hypothetical protein
MLAGFGTAQDMFGILKVQQSGPIAIVDPIIDHTIDHIAIKDITIIMDIVVVV